jgi:hypothetical protein
MENEIVVDNNSDNKQTVITVDFTDSTKKYLKDLITAVNGLIDVIVHNPNSVLTVNNNLSELSDNENSEIDAVVLASNLLSKEYADMLFFTVEANNVIIKPKRFLGSDNFAKIASALTEAGGEYISAGKNSHFKISIDRLT